MSASDHLSPQQFPTSKVPLEHLPVEGESDHPFRVSRHDNPREYPEHFKNTKTFSLQHVPITSLAGGPHCPGGVHGAHCYDLNGDHAHHDNASDDEYSDGDYVRRMAKHADQLPALVSTKGSAGYFGGGHRLAAWHEAGRTHAPVWVPDKEHG
jgi:hypothetical protein